MNRFNTYVLGETYIKDIARRYPRSREQARKRDNDFDLVERVHEAESEVLGNPLKPAHAFTVTLEPDTFTEEKYAVFENYQRVVHHEPPAKISPDGFERFLCNSPLKRRTEVGPDGKEKKLGSYHQCYRLDGRLVAIGVLDLLPDCVSAVYFLYDESIHAYAPGKLSAIREIALALEGGYRWWYAGYYIHNCAKMRYKIEYSPQYVLDPEALTWDLLDRDVLAVFDKKHYVSMSKHRAGQDGDEEAADMRPEAGPPPPPLGAGVEAERDAKEHEVASDEGEESDVEMDVETPFLLTSNFPGLPSLDEMEAADLDNLMIWSDVGFYPACALRIWDREQVSEVGTLKAMIAELAAAVGLDQIDQFCVDFRRRTRS